MVNFDSGYIPYGPKWHAQQGEEARAKRNRNKRHRKLNTPDSSEKSGGIAASPSTDDGMASGYADSGGAFYAPGSAEAASGLQEFYRRDAFVCQGDGRPIWCATCLNWKPDRTHHCREIERCVRKMDHFCPW